jgi:acyl carrier protein
MSREGIVGELKQFFEREFPKPGAELTEETNLLEDWFIDSLAIVDTTLFIEEKFDVSLSRSDITGDNFQTISALADLVTRRLG